MQNYEIPYSIRETLDDLWYTDGFSGRKSKAVTMKEITDELESFRSTKDTLEK